MKHILLLIVTAFVLIGCGPLPEATVVDQCKREVIFKQCMAAVPVGPTVTGGENPWHKVIDSCDDAAKWQSVRKESRVPVECH